MRSRLTILMLAGALLSSTVAFAHHSFTATYDESKVLSIEGQLVQFLFRNPHSFLHMMVPDENGVMQRWSVEWAGAGQLGQQGVTRDGLRPGDHVIISGNPGRSSVQHRLRMQSLHRPSDGFGWGTRPGETFD